MSGRHAWRAVARWGWRMLRRDGRQQLLTVLLLVLAVGAAVTGSAMAVNSQHDDAVIFGTADTVIGFDGADPEVVDRSLAELAERFGELDVVRRTAVDVPGSRSRLDVRGQDPDGPFAGVKLALLAGRYPSGADEVALTPGAADLLGADVGDPVDVAGSTRAVVGLVEDPLALDDDFVLELPRPDAPADLVEAFVTAGRAGLESLPAGGLSAQVRAITRGDHHELSNQAMVVLAVTVLLSLVGLVAAAGFTVAAQRRLRQLGMLAAIGGSDRDLRRVMALNGLVVGLVAALTGTALGIAGWVVMRPATERAAGQRRGSLELPWVIVVVTAVLAVVIAAAAAWWPARQVARLPIVRALSGRPAPPRPVRRSLVAAVALLVVGVVLVSLADPGSDDVEEVLLSLGLIAVICGVVFVAPAAIRAAGCLAGRLPLAPRLALRDLSRFQARAASSLAAITIGLGMAAAIVAVAAANERPETEGNLAPNQFVIEPDDMGRPPLPARTTADEERLDEAAAGVVAAAGGDGAMVALDVMYDPDTRVREPVSVGEMTAGRDGGVGVLEWLGWAYVARPEVLDHFGIDPDSIDPATELLVAEARTVALVSDEPRSAEATPAVTQVVDLPAYSSAPFALVPEARVAEWGWETVRAGWFVEFTGALTDDQVDAARSAAAAAGQSVGVRDDQDTVAAVRRWTTIGGTALALAIVATAVGLIRAESASDLATLSATGASSRTRRSLTAATSGCLAILGAMLGAGGAYVFLVAMYRSDLGALTPLPIGPLVVLVVGVPVVATVGGWLLAGREPATVARRLLD